MRERQRITDLGRRPAQRLGATIHFGVFAFMLAVTMPRLVRSFCPTWDALDASWAWMMGYAQQHQLQWGQSILFTYGPLGFLTHSYFYSYHALWDITATARLVAWFALGLGFAAILNSLATDERPFARTSLPIALGWIIGASFVHLSAQTTFTGVLLLVLAIANEPATVSVPLVIAGALLALGASIKSTGLIISLFVLMIYPALWRYARGRQRTPYLPLLPLASFLISFCALWLLASQRLSNLAAYLRGTWAIASGYTPAMSIPASHLQILSALMILAPLVAVLGSLVLRGKNTRASQCLLLGVVAFWAWKEGFTRPEAGYFRHPMEFYGVMLLIASVGTALISWQDSPRLSIGIYGSYVLAFYFSLQGYPVLSLSYRHVLHNYETYLTLISSKANQTSEQLTQNRAIKAQFKFRKPLLSAVGNASVSVIPWSLMVTQPYRMRLVTSPVIQSYSAYKPYLDRMNAQQIWEGKSAEKIIFSYRSLDRRYPIFDEPDTFRALLTCYRTQYPGTRYAVLDHIACAAPELRELDAQSRPLGTWIKVPPQASYAAISLRTTLFGHLMRVLFKPAEVQISFRLTDGSVKGPYRFIYPVAPDGVFIKYFIGSLSAAEQLFAHQTSGLPLISAIKIACNPRSPDYVRRLRIRFLQTSSRAAGEVFPAALAPSAGRNIR